MFTERRKGKGKRVFKLNLPMDNVHWIVFCLSMKCSSVCSRGIQSSFPLSLNHSIDLKIFG